MKAYVINLERSTERRQHMRRQLERLGLEHEFVAAVNGARLTADERLLVDGHAVAQSPIGCDRASLDAV